MKWKGKLIRDFWLELDNHSTPSNKVNEFFNKPSAGIHLAIFNEPFLTLILKGEKKIETRFSVNKISPFRKVVEGDVVILKESGGFVKGAFIVGKVEYYENTNESTINEIKNKYETLICSSYDETFWESRKKANYVSLIEVKRVKEFKPFKSKKNNRMAWATLKENESSSIKLFAEGQ
jgi:hypothetical protein